MGPPPRGLAAEANDCFMVRPRRGQPNTRSRRDPSRAWRAPLGSLLFAVLDVTDGGSRTVLQPLPPPPNATRVAPGDNLAPVAPTAGSLTPCSAPSKAWPGNANHAHPSSRRPASTAPARGVITTLQAGMKKRCPGRTKKQSRPSLQIPLDRETSHTKQLRLDDRSLDRSLTHSWPAS